MSSAGDPGPNSVTGAKPWWKSRTAVTVILGVVAWTATQLPGYLPQLAPMLPPNVVHGLQQLVLLAALVTSLTGKIGATQDAARLDLAGPDEAARVLKGDGS